MERECCARKKERTAEEKKKLINRLSRIEGQVKGIKNMVENNAYCTDILVQCSAISAAIDAFNKEVLACHVKSCVADDVKNGKTETLDELLDTVFKLIK